AGIAVIAAQQGAGARAGRAGVAGGTRIAVIARGGVGNVHAPRLGPAGVVGAEVAVVAAERRAAHTLPAGAGVVRGAGVGIVAGGPVGGVHAPRLGPAGVVGAEVVVVAAPPRPHALPARAGVARRAGVVIVAGPGPGRIHAARRRVAGVRRAHVGVVARSRRPGTAAEQAGVGHRARIAVVAGFRVEAREPADARRVAGRVAADAPRRAGRARGGRQAGGGAAVAVEPVAVVALLERVEEAVAADLDCLPGDGEEVGLDTAPGESCSLDPEEVRAAGAARDAVVDMRIADEPRRGRRGRRVPDEEGADAAPERAREAGCADGVRHVDATRAVRLEDVDAV